MTLWYLLLQALFTMLQPGDGTYSSALQTFLNNIRNMPTTPGGMVFIQQWGSTRHAANVAFIGLMVSLYNVTGVDRLPNKYFLIF